MRSEQVKDNILAMMAADLDRGGESRISFFLNSVVRGGWEAWLQVETTMSLLAALTPKSGAAPVRTYQVSREVNYPGTLQRCDLHFVPVHSGTVADVAIWIEFKTQRDTGYAATMNDFYSDITKLSAISKDQTVVATAVLMNDAAVWAAPTIRIPTGSKLRRYNFTKASASASAKLAASEVMAFDNKATPLCIVWTGP